MTQSGASPRLTVEADLRLDVDGVQARITGRGDHVYVTTDHPVRLLRSGAPLARTAGSHRSRAALSKLVDEGLTITIVGRHGELVHLGADAGARGLRLATPQAARGVLAAAAVLAATSVVARLRRRSRQPD